MDLYDDLPRLMTALAGLFDEKERAAALHEIAEGAPGGEGAVLRRLIQRAIAERRRLEELLAERTAQLGLVLEVLRTRDEIAAEQQEWDFATELQTAGLPQKFPPFPERREFDLHAGMVTAKEVGGDLYDFFLLAPNRLGFVVADAAGKGIPAAVFITLTRTLLKAAASRMADPGACLTTVNSMLCLDNPSVMFATAFYGTLDTDTGEVRYANAGHNPPYVMRADGSVEAVPVTGEMALGVFEENTYAARRLRLAPGEVLVCYSDGVTEAINVAGELFLDERLAAVLAAQRSRQPDGIIASVVAEVDRFMGLAAVADDLTLLALRYNGRPPSSAGSA